jgi:hypothetical protein
VLKQGKAATKKISRRFMIMSARELMWFHDIEEYESGATALGAIKIIDIYKCSETLMMHGSYDFDIGVTGYVKKGQQDNVPRVINFGCESESDRHEWITRIEFLRAKTVYENYVNKFVNIQFPLKQVDDVEDDSQQKNEQIFEKLNHFAKNFRQNVQINASAVHRPQQPPMVKRSTTNMRSSNRGFPRNSVLTQLEHTSAFGPEDFFAEYQSQQPPNAVSAKDLAHKVLNLYRASMVAFHVQTTTHANKTLHNSIKNKPIGQIPDHFELLSQQPNDSILSSAEKDTIQSPEVADLQHRSRSRSPLLKKTISEGGNLVPEPKRLEDKVHSATETMRRRVSMNDGRSAPGELKKNEMEIVQEQEEGSQGSSNSSKQHDGDKAKKSRRERRG